MFIVNVEGVIFKNDNYLVILRSMKEEHAGGTLSLVGGKVENEGNHFDILERTVKREIFEEVGVEVKDQMRYVYSNSFITEDHCSVVDIVFLCEYVSGEAFPKSPDEVDEVFWMTYEEIVNHPKTPPWLKESINRAGRLRREIFT